MIPSLNTAASALAAHQQFLDVVANNLANVNTVGFKESKTLFGDELSLTLYPPASNTQANAAQIGMGVTLGAVTQLFTQGSLQPTGSNTNLAIDGSGFFVVKDAATGAQYYTRAGAFKVDAQGYLISPTGQRVQGGGPAAVDGDPYVDLQIPTEVGVPPVSVTSFNIDSTGRIIAVLQDGSTSIVGKVALERFSNPNMLLKIGDNLFQAQNGSGPSFSSYHAAASDGLGQLRAGYLEMSNVDLSAEFTDMIRAQRGLQANAKVVTTSDEIIQDLVNLKR